MVTTDWSDCQVQRYLADLEAMGLIRRIERRSSHRGKISNEYDLQGLVDKFAEIEPDFREAGEHARQVRKAAARPGLKGRRQIAKVAKAAGA
ncbi:hypothetical protein L284_17205 [Novosphingobium lindaniclasticum LE124]|uniref:Uncharacterized protein n=2 Tax=Novosphingobium TaxID=165696 RepID=T0H209_9SPHN|nr:hypothetical protein L284_17205 [Novosphingobium lindaniclasticum LE124]